MILSMGTVAHHHSPQALRRFPETNVLVRAGWA